EAGGAPPADLARGELAASRARLMVETARAELQAAKRQLASNWTGSLNDVGAIRGRLRHNGHARVELPILRSALERHPAVLIWAAVAAQRKGDLMLQRATASPDLTLGVGAKRVFESNDTTFRVGGSIPLPVHDRN